MSLLLFDFEIVEDKCHIECIYFVTEESHKMAKVIGGKAMDAVVTNVTDRAIDSLWRQIGYVWNYKSNICDLENQLEVVKDKMESMKHSMEAAIMEGEIVEKEAANWYESADAAIRADNLLAELGAVNKSCFMGYCPNLMTRHRCSRKTKEIMPSLDKVKQDGAFISKISHPIDVQKLERPTNHLSLGSRMEIMEDILGALKSSDVNLVGVFGCSGVGKSTLVKQVVAHVKEKNIFKVVAMVNVTHPLILSELQQEIAEWLGLEFRGASSNIRALQLCARLKQEEKVLIILDNICGRIPLEEIGIPEKKDHKGCKILMASKQLDVLSKMGVQKHFQLKILKKDEAWQLFETKTGDFRDPRIQSIAREVAKRCLGLPVLIVEVASSLRDEELGHWEDALKDLDDMDNESILVGPWGGNGGTAWDDGIYTGVREIILYCGLYIDSIQVVYDKNGKPVRSEKHGGNGGTKKKISLQFPEEFLVSASGHYINSSNTVIRSITFKSNKNNTFGPYGMEEGIPFTLSTDGASIVGFMGRSGCFLDAIGFRLSRSQSTEPLQKVRQRLQRLDSLVTTSSTLLTTLKRVVGDE